MPRSREEINKVVAAINNKVRIKDWAQAETLYKDLNKTMEKDKKNINVHGPPKAYLACVARLQDVVNEAYPNRKQLNKLSASALTNLRKGITRYARETTLGSKTVGALSVHSPTRMRVSY